VGRNASRVETAFKRRGNNPKRFKHLSLEPRPESGLDCHVSAIFARQRNVLACGEGGGNAETQTLGGGEAGDGGRLLGMW